MWGQRPTWGESQCNWDPHTNWILDALNDAEIEFTKSKSDKEQATKLSQMLKFPSQDVFVNGRLCRSFISCLGY